MLNGKLVSVDFGSCTSAKEKKLLIDLLAMNGARVSFILNKKVDFLLKDDRKELDTYKCRNAFKLGLPVVHVSYVTDYINSDFDSVDIKPYLIKDAKNEENLKKGKIGSGESISINKSNLKPVDLKKLQVYKQIEDILNEEFESNGYNVLKWSIFKEKPEKSLIIVEIHVSSNSNVLNKHRIRVEKNIFNKKSSESNQSVETIYSENPVTTFSAYQQILKPYLNDRYEFTLELPPDVFYGSKMLQTATWKLSIEKSENLSGEVGDFVNYVWNESLGDLQENFDIDIEKEGSDAFFSKFSIQQLNKAECVLQKQRDEPEFDHSDEFYKILPFKKPKKSSIKKKRVLREKFEICQVLRDILSISESTNWNLRAPLQSKYRSIGCCVKPLSRFSPHFENVKNQLISSTEDEKSFYEVLNVYEIIRPNEFYNFVETMPNRRQLFHGSRANNFVGILSRGLLMPKFVSDEFGDEARSDVGNLGSGLYFSDSISLSAKYSMPSNSKNTRLVVLCDVALGKSFETNEYRSDLNKTPDGFNSVLGVKRNEYNESPFSQNEFAIYDVRQYRIRYLIEFRNRVSDGEMRVVNEVIKSSPIDQNYLLTNQDLDPDMTEKKVKIEESSLVSESGKKLPLRSVHVRAKLVDMVAKVVIYQEFENDESEPIEAKYVFPLTDTSCVCGFEAFINDKHVVGICKEKEQARREYREAIEQGKGAYLMDQESAELFTVSVGNLPAKTRCIIKITYVSELDVQNETIVFKLPNHVAAWQTIDAEKTQLQQSVLTKFINGIENQMKNKKYLINETTTFQASILMPFEIKSISCPTHHVKIKQTACQAVLEMLKLKDTNSG